MDESCCWQVVDGELLVGVIPDSCVEEWLDSLNGIAVRLCPPFLPFCLIKPFINTLIGVIPERQQEEDVFVTGHMPAMHQHRCDSRNAWSPEKLKMQQKTLGTSCILEPEQSCFHGALP